MADDKKTLPRNFTTKYEIAQLYFKDAHGITSENVQRLARKIRTNPTLVEELKKAKYVKTQRYFSPKQLSLIYEHCEEPII